VSQVFDQATLATLQGHLAIGHTRYSTTGGSRLEKAQPAFKPTAGGGGGLALAHNGNLTNTAVMAAELTEVTAAEGSGEPKGGVPVRSGAAGGAAPPGRRPDATCDIDVMAQPLAREADLSLEEPIVRIMPRLHGAFSLVIMDEGSYDIDLPTRAELASDLLSDEVASYVSADSLGYLSLEALAETAAAPGVGSKGLCTACFTGNYPIPIPDAAGPDLTPSAATQPSTLPLPNP
jgi:glutamine phosphoribosylpyrophosphate amidotransferase